jgi:protein-disulfide isomerase
MENNNQNVLGILTFVGVVAVLLLGVTGKFAGAGSLTKADIESAVKAAMPTAAAPAAQPQPAAPQPAPAPEVTKVDLGELEAFYDTAVIDGDADAKVTVIEFSDVECPFCQRHSNNGTIDAVKTKYAGKVNAVFAHFPLSFHPNAQKAGEAIECAGKLGGDEGFLKFKKAIFVKGGQPTLAVIEEVAKAEGLDATAMMACVNGGEFAQKVTDQMAFGRKLGITGTPGNVVMNNETGEFVKVSGAVPAEAFAPAVDQFLN